MNVFIRFHNERTITLYDIDETVHEDDDYLTACRDGTVVFATKADNILYVEFIHE